MRAAIEDFMNCFFGREICFKGTICCSEIFVLSFREMKREERPKRPVRRGRRGSFIGRFRVAKPRNPAKRKIVSERRNFSSLKIK